MENKDILKNLKPGDELCYDCTFGAPNKITVMKITPTGIIVDEHGCRYKHGYYRSSSWSGSRQLRKITKKDIEDWEKVEHYAFIRDFDFRKCTLYQFREVVKIIKDSVVLKHATNSCAATPASAGSDPNGFNK